VSVLADEQVLGHIDDALSSSCVPIDSLMRRMFSLGFRPSDEAGTLIFAVGLYVVNYNAARSLDSTELESLAHAKSQVLGHPVVSSFLASKGYHLINDAAGVTN